VSCQKKSLLRRSRNDYSHFAYNSVQTVTDSLNSINSQTLGYDALDRLTSAGGGYGTYAWAWDAVSNVATHLLNNFIKESEVDYS
jgi:hypothetical protein